MLSNNYKPAAAAAGLIIQPTVYPKIFFLILERKDSSLTTWPDVAFCVLDAFPSFCVSLPKNHAEKEGITNKHKKRLTERWFVFPGSTFANTRTTQLILRISKQFVTCFTFQDWLFLLWSIFLVLSCLICSWGICWKSTWGLETANRFFLFS